MTEFRFIVEFRGQLDGIAGACHDETMFHYLATREFNLQSHYHTTATILETTDQRGVLGGWRSMDEGWIMLTRHQVEARESPVEDEVEFQVKTRGVAHTKWLTNDDPNLGWDLVEREWGKPDQITHYRLRNDTPQHEPHSPLSRNPETIHDHMFPNGDKLLMVMRRVEYKEQMVDLIEIVYLEWLGRGDGGDHLYNCRRDEHYRLDQLATALSAYLERLNSQDPTQSSSYHQPFEAVVGGAYPPELIELASVINRARYDQRDAIPFEKEDRRSRDYALRLARAVMNHLGRTPASVEDDRWLVDQLEAWPERVDGQKTTNIQYLMQSAARRLRQLLGD